MSENNPRQVPGERKAIYYVGLVLIVIGMLLFFSVFISAAVGFGRPMGGMGTPFDDFGGIALRGFIGIVMAMVGSLLMNLGARGLAGSGVVLDPQQARKDLEPWSRMAGGMVKDAVDEAGIHPAGMQNPIEQGELPFDEKLRRLEKLRQDGLLTEAEYKQKRAELLNEKW